MVLIASTDIHCCFHAPTLLPHTFTAVSTHLHCFHRHSQLFLRTNIASTDIHSCFHAPALLLQTFTAVSTHLHCFHRHSQLFPRTYRQWGHRRILCPVYKIITFIPLPLLLILILKRSGLRFLYSCVKDLKKCELLRKEQEPN
jgi:hypothetical protein